MVYVVTKILFKNYIICPRSYFDNVASFPDVPVFIDAQQHPRHQSALLAFDEIFIQRSSTIPRVEESGATEQRA